MTRPQLPAWHYNRLLADLSTDGVYAHCAAPVTLAAKWVDRLRHGPRPSKGLYLHGPVGSGKTSVAAAVAVELDALYWDARALLAAMKEEMSLRDVRYPALERCVRAPVLVLDDIGKARSTDWVVETMQDLIERRFDRGGLLVSTSNLDPAGMRGFLGEAAWSRFTSTNVSVPVVSQDLRVVA